MDKEKAFNLMIKHLEINEDVKSLSKKLEITNQTKRRIEFKKTTNTCWLEFNDKLSKAFHEAKVNVLKEYADIESLNKYMEKEGFRFNYTNKLSNIMATTFILYYTSDENTTMNFVKKKYPNRFNFWEFEKIDDKHSIAYD